MNITDNKNGMRIRLTKAELAAIASTLQTFRSLRRYGVRVDLAGVEKAMEKITFMDPIIPDIGDAE